MPDRLSDFQKQLGHQFDDQGLLRVALTHRSFGRPNNERLEFLGDAVLGTAVSDLLFKTYTSASEGEMSRARATLVSRDGLARVALKLGLGNYIRLGAGEEKSGGRERESLLADTFEAVLAAVYLDAGFQRCQELVEHLFDIEVLEVRENRDIDNKDYKTRLQELLQAQGLPLPVYEVVATSGKAHQQRFQVRCEVALLETGCEGAGSSKRAAEQDAARVALQQLAGREGTP